MLLSQLTKHIHPYWLGCEWNRSEGAICLDKELPALPTSVSAKSAVVHPVRFKSPSRLCYMLHICLQVLYDAITPKQ